MIGRVVGDNDERRLLISTGIHNVSTHQASFCLGMPYGHGKMRVLGTVEDARVVILREPFLVACDLGTAEIDRELQPEEREDEIPFAKWRHEEIGLVYDLLESAVRAPDRGVRVVDVACIDRPLRDPAATRVFA